MRVQYDNAMLRTTSLSHEGTCKFQLPPVKFKPSHRSSWNFARLIMLARPSEVSNLIGIRAFGVALHVSEIYVLGFFLTSFFVTSTGRTAQPIFTIYDEGREEVSVNWESY